MASFFTYCSDDLERAEESAIPGTTQKYRIMWRDNPATTMTIGWVQTGKKEARVYYGTDDHGQDYEKYENVKEVDQSRDYKSMKHKFARLTGLQPDQAYYFVIRDEEYTSPRFWFLTAPNTAKRITAISGGDSRNNREIRRKANAMVAKLRPLFVMFGGDMTEFGTSSEWKAWLNDWQLTIAEDGRMFPVIAARGNHEKSNKEIEYIFDVPSSNVTYGLTIGGNFLRVYTLNSEISIAGDQTTWLSNDLAANNAVKWKFAQYHKPMRPHVKSKSEQDGMYNSWANLFYQHKVQVVVESDAHTVKTTWPVRPSTNGDTAQPGDVGGAAEGFRRNDNGTVYMGEGTWGAPLRGADDSKVWTRDAGKFNQFKWINIASDKVEIRTVRYENADEVNSVDDLNPYTPPANIDIWNAPNGSTVTIQAPGVTSVPAVTVNSPSNNAFYNSGQSVLIDVAATDTNGIDRVEFYANGTFLGQDVSAPYTYMWASPPPGVSTITVNAVNINEASTEAYRLISVGTQTKSWRISSTNDDAEEKASNGDIDLNSSDLELTYDSNSILPGFGQVIGLRFTGVDIPNGATVVNAYIQFTTDETDDETTVLNIKGEKVGYAGAFNSTDYDISSRSTTGAAVQWIVPAWSTVGAAQSTQRTPNIT